MRMLRWSVHALVAPLLVSTAIYQMSGPADARMPKSGSLNPPSMTILVQDSSENPASASELKDVLADIKRRLAEQQEGRQSTGTGELTAELKAARQTISELTQGMNRLRAERDNILSELQRMGDEISLRSDQIATLERELESEAAQSSAERSALEADLAERLAERDAARGELADTASKLDASLAEIDQLTASLDQAWEERAGIEQEFEQVRTTMGAEAEDRDRTIAGANAEIDRLTLALSGETSNLQAANATLTELRIQLQAMTTAAQDVSRDSDRMAALAAGLEDELAAEQAAKANVEDELSEQRERVRQVSLEAEGRLKERTSTLTSSIQSAELRIDELETEIGALREVATTSVAEVQVLGEQLLNTLEENKELVNALTEVRASKSIIEGELEAVRRDVDLYSAQAALGGRSENSEVIANLQSELRAAKAENTELVQQVIRQEQLTAIEGDPSTLAERLEELEAELASVSALNEGLNAELAALKGGDEPPPVIRPIAINNQNIARLLNDLNAVDTGDGWLMTVPEGIIFAPGSDQLADAANEPLTQVAAMLRYFSDVPVRIVGHTDSYGDPEVNRVLSVARAESVRNYLSDNFGLSAGRIQTEGFGEEQPIASNDSVSGRRANRRVEIYVQAN